MKPTILPRLLLFVLLGLCSGCSSFDARWRAAGTGGTTRWDGRWTSEKHVTRSGAPMGGRLRAVLEPAADGHLSADFHANWLIFSDNYTMTLEPKSRPAGPRRDAAREYHGTHELPKAFGGIYHYEARISGDQFTARYTSSYDHGAFTLHRLPARKD